MMVEKKQINFPRYEHYKDSGIEWIGEIPAHWELKKASHYFRAKKGSNAAILTKEYCGSIQGDYPVYSGQTENDGILASINNYEFDYSNSGCILTTTVGAKAMNVSYLQGRFSLSQNCMIIEPKSLAVNMKYYSYLFTTIFSYYRELIPDHMQASFRMEDFYGMRYLLPTSDEQTAIAQFLDHKTAQIDRAIAIKEAQIKLLNERKQIMIQEAVTKGLDPSVPMKDSGIEWIGEIPAHWDVKLLRHIGFTQNGVSEGAEYFGLGHPFVSYGDVYNDFQLPSSVKGLANSSELDRRLYSVQIGDVFFTRTSETIDEIGISSTCLQTIPNAVFSGFLIRFRPTKKELDEGFSSYYFSTTFVRNFFTSKLNLVTRVSLSQGLLKKLPVLLPPKSEQKTIFNFLENQKEKINMAINVYESQIQTLKEYKTTLINEAVTGKIKVY